MKLHPLPDLNVAIDYENFNPKRSEVSMSLSLPSPPNWKPTQPTSRKWSDNKGIFVQVISDRRFLFHGYFGKI